MPNKTSKKRKNQQKTPKKVPKKNIKQKGGTINIENNTVIIQNPSTQNLAVGRILDII